MAKTLEDMQQICDSFWKNSIYTGFAMYKYLVDLSEETMEANVKKNRRSAAEEVEGAVDLWRWNVHILVHSNCPWRQASIHLRGYGDTPCLLRPDKRARYWFLCEDPYYRGEYTTYGTRKDMDNGWWQAVFRGRKSSRICSVGNWEQAMKRCFVQIMSRTEVVCIFKRGLRFNGKISWVRFSEAIVTEVERRNPKGWISYRKGCFWQGECEDQ